ncbi:MAG: calcium/sodium antiporter [Waddliaceae bacterium]
MILSLFFGAASLWIGAESLVRGAASFAFRLGLPVLVISLTILGYGTGMPELVVSLQASLAGEGDIAIGNVIGSNIANSALILGFAGACRSFQVKPQLFRRDLPIMALVSFILWGVLLFTDTIGRVIGLIFLLGLLCYTWQAIKSGRENHMREAEEIELKGHLIKSVWIELVLIAFGFIFLFLGGRLFLSGAIMLAETFNISDAVIGLTVVALGTSLPELAVSIVAIIRRQPDIIMGNIVGSNIFNILAIIGLASLVRPIEVVGITWVDATYMLGLAVLMWILAQTQLKIVRWEGALLLLSYVVYIATRLS